MHVMCSDIKLFHLTHAACSSSSLPQFKSGKKRIKPRFDLLMSPFGLMWIQRNKCNQDPLLLVPLRVQEPLHVRKGWFYY